MDLKCEESVISGLHGRQRRYERKIDKADMNEARRYGMKELAGDGCVKYTYKGCVFVVNPVQNKEITSYTASDWASPFSGTRCTVPELFPLEKSAASRERIEEHKKMRRKLKHKASSHTVFLIDMCSNTRQDDVDGARCRSDAWWMTIARAFVHERLSKNQSVSDGVVSIVVMHSGEASIYCKFEPVDHVLYNMLIDLREWSTLRPNGKANLLQGLDVTEELFQKSPSSSSLKLFVALDSSTAIGLHVEDCISRLGELHVGLRQRLTTSMTCLCSESDDLPVLDEISRESACFVQRAALDVHSLSAIVSDFASMRAVSVSESTIPPHGHTTTPYSTLRRALTWNIASDTMAEMLDERCPSCYTLVGKGDASGSVDASRGWKCAACHCYFCVDCMDKFTWHLGSSDCRERSSKLLSGQLVDRSLPSHQIRVDNASSSGEAIFTGRRLHFVDKEGKDLGRRFFCKDLGASEWSAVDERLRKASQDHCKALALASFYSKSFSGALQTVETGRVLTFLHPVRHQYPEIMASVPFVVEVEPQGCYQVEENFGESRPVSQLMFPDVNTFDLVEALGHFSFEKSQQKLLVVPVRGTIYNGSFAIIEAVLLESSDSHQTSFGVETFVRTHECNDLCRLLALGPVR